MLGDTICKFLLNIFGYVWPAYQCYKAVESNRTDEIRDWCIYWFTMAVFTTAERFLDLFVFWMPLYYEAKLLFVVWLWHPKTRGAVYLYTRTLQPLLTAHEATIDQKLEEFKAVAGDFISGNFGRAMQFLQSQAHVVVGKLQSIQNSQRGGGGGGAPAQQTMGRRSSSGYDSNSANPYGSSWSHQAAQAARNAFSGDGGARQDDGPRQRRL